MSCNLARSCPLVALSLVKFCKGDLCSYLRTRGCGGRTSCSVVALRFAKIFRRLYESKALKDDSPMDEEAFVFGAFRLLPAQRMLLEDGKPVHLGSRALDVLVALIQSAGDTLHKDQLIACAWPDTVVEESALRVNVAALRRALGDGRGGNRFITNIPGRGYSFV